ncbi:MAG: Ig-like domain-containing protein [Spirochaetes bacterium]|nr:Ig-like domain-containing protein [Spirochaetota bacterium]
MLLIFDNTAPQVSFVSPTNGTTVYSNQTIRGSSSDNSRLSKVEVRIGKAGTGSGDGFVAITGSLYDWTRDFLSNDYANGTQSTDRGDSTWELPIYCRVYDVAGNVATNEPSNPADPLYPAALAATYGSALSFDPAKVPAFNLVIDLDRDKPTLVIQMPRDAVNTAGTVLVGGTCYDESPGMASVKLQIQALDDTMVPIKYVKKDGTDTDSSYWEAATLNSSKTYWQVAINENDGLYSVAPNHQGNVSSITVRLDNSIPRLENPRFTLNGVDVPAQDYLYARGSIRLKAKVRDDQAVMSIKISLDGGSSYGGELIGTGSVVQNAVNDFDINYQIDTLNDTQIPGAIRTAKNGLLTVGVKVQDNASPAPYVNAWFATLNMDNLFPTGSYTGTALNGHDPMLLSGNKISSSQVMGTSADAGTVSGIDKVEVYLVREPNVLNLSTGALVLRESGTFGDPPAAAAYTTDPLCKVVIDWTKVGVVDNMQLAQNGANVDWWVKLNTSVLPDGPVEIHFVAFDRAGNGTHGSQAGYIVNHAPVIDSITLGTDVNGDGSIGDVASGESKVFSSGYPATGFTVRNGKLKITIAALSGNGTKRYSIKYAGLTEKNVSPFTDNWVEISDFAGMSDGSVNGSTFDVLVYDSTVSDDDVPTGELTATATLGMTFDNVDDAPPTIAVAPFGKRYGSNNDDSAKSLATVGSYNDNIVMNVSVRTGHIEYQGQSLFDGSDADISGQVIFRGKASDNQRIKSITVQIPGFNPPDPDGAGPLPDPGGAGVEFEVAAWSGGALVSNYSGTLNATNTWSLSVEAPFLTELHGHALNWAFSWNSASIANYAQANVSATFRIYDHASPSNSGSNAVTVDVVPYIAAVKTTQTSNGGIKVNNIRSSLGKYSVKTGAIADFITIEGFNLNPIANGIRVSSATYPSGLNGTTLMGNSLAVNAPSADRTTVTVSNATTASGYLTVVSGTAGAPVPSGNNGNDNNAFVDLNGDATAQLAEQYNREPDEVYVKNRLLTDDRYIDFFTVTDTGFTSSFFPNMLMSGDTPIWGYVQGGAANDLQVRRGTSSGSNIGLVRILSADQLTMAQDDDAIYHMVSVNNFSQGRMVYLYNFFETTPGYAPNGGATSPYWSGYTGVFAGASGNNAIELDSVNYGSLSLSRYAGLQLVTKGRSNTAGQYSRVYLGYYDQSTGELLFRNYRVGLAAAGNNLYSTGRSNQADTTVTSGDAARKLVSSSASQYFAMGVTDQNRVVFVYYDQAAGRLKVTYSTAGIDLASPTDAVTFSAPVDIPADYVGWYVSLAIETDGLAGTPDPIHIAAYDTSDGDLRYAYMTSYADASPQIVRVDANNSVGIYTSVKVRGGKPWISYYNNSENGTRDSIKLARYPPQGGLTKFLKVNLDFNTTGDPILGYAASSIEHSRRLPEVTP